MQAIYKVAFYNMKRYAKEQRIAAWTWQLRRKSGCTAIYRCYFKKPVVFRLNISVNKRVHLLYQLAVTSQRQGEI